MARTWSLAVPHISQTRHMPKGSNTGRQAERKVILPRMEEGEAESPPLGEEKTKSWLSKTPWARYHDEWNRSWHFIGTFEQVSVLAGERLRMSWKPLCKQTAERRQWSLILWSNTNLLF